MKMLVEIETGEWPDNGTNHEAVIRVIQGALQSHFKVREINEKKQCQSTKSEFPRLSR